MVYHKGLKVLSMSGLLAPLLVIVTKKGLYWVSQHYAVKLLPLKMNLCSMTISHVQEEAYPRNVSFSFENIQHSMQLLQCVRGHPPKSLDALVCTFLQTVGA